MFDRADFLWTEVSVAVPSNVAVALGEHFNRPGQEDLTFAIWRPSSGQRRFTAIISELIPPADGDRLMHGNVAFTGQYLRRALATVPPGAGLALVHSHLGPGWQGMSYDDMVAERDRLAGPATGTKLPLLGLTWGTDGSLSARIWLRTGPGQFERSDASSVRVVGERLRLTFHPKKQPRSESSASLNAAVSVWGEEAQADISRVRVGVIGLGSVGSIVAEGLARSGVSRFVLIDPDRIEGRNLDRTAGAVKQDAVEHCPKVEVAKRNVEATATAATTEVVTFDGSLLTEAGLGCSLDCDVLFSCVDRPWPRHVLNALSYSHLIPVIDGGILAVMSQGKLVHADWRVQTIGPARACLICIGALNIGDVQLDMAGRLDDPDYIQGLPDHLRERHGRRNIFAFSLGVSSHELLHFAGLVTGNKRISGIGPQTYHCYPGDIMVSRVATCDSGCDYAALTATAADLHGNVRPL